MRIASFVIGNLRSWGEDTFITIKPLTILIGENNTGKTTLLSAFSALAKGELGKIRPDFNQYPFNCGRFEDLITSPRNGRKKPKEIRLGAIAETPSEGVIGLFSTYRGFEKQPLLRKGRGFTGRAYFKFKVIKPKDFNIKRVFKVELQYYTNIKKMEDIEELLKGTEPEECLKDTYKFQIKEGELNGGILSELFIRKISEEYYRYMEKTKGKIKTKDFEYAKKFTRFFSTFPDTSEFYTEIVNVPPVREKPVRFYDVLGRDPSRPIGVKFAIELDHSYTRKNLKLLKALRAFGKKSGLYTNVRTSRFGGKDSPVIKIEIEVGKKYRNIVDVGFGVSQILPVVVDILKAPEGSIITLQQPEVHLHPKAQAAFASLLVELIKRTDKVFIVETHSEHIVDRIRAEIRKGRIKPKNVCTYFLEIKKGKTKAHELEIDGKGDIKNAPASYRAFFLKELRSLFSGD